MKAHEATNQISGWKRTANDQVIAIFADAIYKAPTATGNYKEWEQAVVIRGRFQWYAKTTNKVAWFVMKYIEQLDSDEVCRFINAAKKAFAQSSTTPEIAAWNIFNGKRLVRHGKGWHEWV